MKKFLTLLLLVCSLASAQTRPDWLQINNKPSLDIRNYGAIAGDGISDSVAIQAAIDAAAALGRSVYIPSGDFTITTGLTVTYDNFTLVGEPGQSILTMTAAGTILTFTSSLPYDQRLTGVVFKSDAGASATRAIHSAQSAFVGVFDTCEFYGFTNTAVYIENSVKTTFSHCFSRGNNHAGTGVSETDWGAGDIGVAIAGTLIPVGSAGFSTTTTFVNCTFELHKFGVQISNMWQGVITGCVFEYCWVGLNLYKNPDIGGTVFAEDNIVNNCWFEGNHRANGGGYFTSIATDTVAYAAEVFLNNIYSFNNASDTIYGQRTGQTSAVDSAGNTTFNLSYQWSSVGSVSLSLTRNVPAALPIFQTSAVYGGAGSRVYWRQIIQDGLGGSFPSEGGIQIYNTQNPGGIDVIHSITTYGNALTISNDHATGTVKIPKLALGNAADDARPGVVAGSQWIGTTYFSETQGIPLYFNGTDWVSATGSIIISGP